MADEQGGFDITFSFLVVDGLTIDERVTLRNATAFIDGLSVF